jgi:hypothetical protein
MHNGLKHSGAGGLGGIRTLKPGDVTAKPFFLSKVTGFVNLRLKEAPVAKQNHSALTSAFHRSNFSLNPL